jgi:hypothetical protein
MAKRLNKNYGCPRVSFRPYNLLFHNTNLSTLNPCNPTALTLHVQTNCQHVSLILLSKSNHVASVVASFNLPVGALSLLRLHCFHQWNEGFEYVHSHNILNFGKTDLQDSIKPGLNSFFQTSTNQLRPVYVSATQKGYNFRRIRHKISFKPSDGLIIFQNAVLEHFKDTGMDLLPTSRTHYQDPCQVHGPVGKVVD